MESKEICCCVGVFLFLLLIVLAMAPSHTDTDAQTNSVNEDSLSEVAKTQKVINVTTSDYFDYFGDDTAPGMSDYNIGVEIDGEEYYLSSNDWNPMLDHSKTVNDLILYYGEQTRKGNDDESFSVPVDVPFSFTFHGGEQVGLNDNAKEIDDIWINGKKITY